MGELSRETTHVVVDRYSPKAVHGLTMKSEWLWHDKGALQVFMWYLLNKVFDILTKKKLNNMAIQFIPPKTRF